MIYMYTICCAGTHGHDSIVLLHEKQIDQGHLQGIVAHYAAVASQSQIDFKAAHAQSGASEHGPIVSFHDIYAKVAELLCAHEGFFKPKYQGDVTASGDCELLTNCDRYGFMTSLMSDRIREQVRVPSVLSGNLPDIPRMQPEPIGLDMPGAPH